MELNRTISKIRLHYFDRSGRTYQFGIEEHRAVGYKQIRSFTKFDARKKTSTTEEVEEEFRFDASGEKLNLNGIDARYVPWADGTQGGYLRWIQEDTFIELDSALITKNGMVQIAQSMTSSVPLDITNCNVYYYSKK